MPWFNIPQPVASLLGKSTLVTFGDSITNDGFAPAPNYTTRLGLTLNVTITNEGIVDSPLQNTNRIPEGTPKSNNGRDRYVADLTGAAKKDLVVILYGTNDLINNDGGETYTSVLFKADYQEVITGLLAAGYAANEIILCSTPWFENGYSNVPGGEAEGLLYDTAIRDLAVSNGTLFADTYAALKDNVDAYQVDGVHPNLLGQQLLSVAIANAAIITL